MTSLLRSFLSFLLLARIILAQFALSEHSDLTNFVTRPEIKAPRFDVVVHHPTLVGPGYWFVAPYADMEPDPPTKKYMPCQVGPHIYDGTGTLVWAGSCEFQNQNTFDFKAVNNIDDEVHLSFIREHDLQGYKGGGLILDSHYKYENEVPVTNDLGAFDIHEFNILDGGETALVTMYRPEFLNFTNLGLPLVQGWVMTCGFEEIRVATGQIVFEWRSLAHIPLNESTTLFPGGPIPFLPGWDYLHVNSVDKNADGDYLLSARFTDTIYLISGYDGHIIWRLGGRQSDFVLQNFRFYRQHDVRFVRSNSTHIILSFLNNASDEVSQDEPWSSALVVVLDIAAMTAVAFRRYTRPDGGLSRLRGNVQMLPNGNVFVGWSERGYHSEFTDNGTCVMEAEFGSDRFSTYRSYKFDFHGQPNTPPDLTAFVYGSPSSNATTVFYVSWNGATEVASWNFYAQATAGGQPVLIGNVPKTGFETMFVSDGYMNWVSAEALDADGDTLGISKTHITTIPDTWFAPNSDSFEKLPVPEDPETITKMEDTQTEKEDDEKNAAATAAALTHDFLSGIGGLLILALFLISTGLLAGVSICALRRHLHHSSYQEIPSERRPALRAR